MKKFKKTNGGGLLETNNQLERFTKDKKNKKMIYSIVGILLIIGSITLYKTFAFYEEKKSFNVLKGRIPDFGYDIKLLSVVVNDKKSESIPERGLYKTNVHCTNGTFGEWDYNNWNLVLNNVSSESKCNVSFTSGLSQEEYNKYIEAGKALHRNTYRGKDITDYYNDGSLYTRISNGSFEDIYVGDYVIANDITWLIADIDNYLHSGATELTKHHVTIIPATPLMNAPMNATATTEGGYAGSRMATSTLPSLAASDGIIGKAFGSHIIECQNMLSRGIDATAINSSGGITIGASNGVDWYTRKIDLMSEINVYGGNVWSSSGHDTGMDNNQYALFQLKPEFINSYENTRFGYWLKNVVSVHDFSVASIGRDALIYPANHSLGLRPRFLIG